MWMRRRSSSQPSRNGQGEFVALLQAAALWALRCSGSYTHNSVCNPTGKSGANFSPVAAAHSIQSVFTCTSCLPASCGGADGSARGCLL